MRQYLTARVKQLKSSKQGKQISDCSADYDNLRSPEMKIIGVIGSMKKIPLYGCSLTNGDQMRVTK